MYTSLRFPDGKSYPEVTLSPEAVDLAGILTDCGLTPQQYNTVLRLLPLSCPDPDVLSYRAELAAELFSSPRLQQILGEFAAIDNRNQERNSAENKTAETDKLQTISAFEDFCVRFDKFRTSLDGFVPQSAAAKRFFLFCRNYGEGFEYKELKIKAAELRRELKFELGYTLIMGSPADDTGSIRLHKGVSVPLGICTAATQVLKEFGASKDGEQDLSRTPYTDVETAILTGIIRKDPKLSRRLEEFYHLYQASDFKTLMRLKEEALFYTAVNQIYKAGEKQGYTVCCPAFRNPGFYTEILGLNFTSETDKTEKADYITSPLNHITVAVGPDADAYLRAVGFAHLCASAGGLVFAQEAAISPVNHLEYDNNTKIRTNELNEEGLCLCTHLFDAMLPRQEEAAVNEVILRLNDQHPRSVIRICSKSNLSILQKKMDGGLLPPCTLLQIGTDRTLEELLQRHKLTAQCLEEEA